MAKNSKSKKSQNSKQPKLTKSDLIKLYVTLKKQNKDHRKEIFRDDFIKQPNVSKYLVTKHFGNYSNFKDHAEAEYLKKLPKQVRSLLSERSKKFDEFATEDDCIEDLRRVQEDNEARNITRNIYREEGKYSDSTWNQFFGTFQEFRRKAGLELTRHQHQLERHIAKHASIDHYREFYETEVLPYFDKYKKESPHPHHIKTILAMSDLHDKECCEFSLSVFVDQCKRKQPDVIVLNGDIYDMLEFGKYTTDPRHWDIEGRFKFVRDRVFKPLREFCPNAQIDFIAGNHEMRLVRLLADATPNVRILLSDVMDIQFKDIFGLDEFQINWASKFDLAAYTNADMKNEIKKNYRIYYDVFCFSHIPDERLKKMYGSNGHHHKGRIESYTNVDPITNLEKQTTWSQTPGMHVKDAEYLGNISGWNTGFLEVQVNLKTQEAIQHVRFTHDSWTVIDGVVYERK